MRHLVWCRLSYAACAVIERFFGVAKRHYGLDTHAALGWDAIVRQVTLTVCAILVVALAAQRAGTPSCASRLPMFSPTSCRFSPTAPTAHDELCSSPDVTVQGHQQVFGDAEGGVSNVLLQHVGWLAGRRLGQYLCRIFTIPDEVQLHSRMALLKEPCAGPQIGLTLVSVR